MAPYTHHTREKGKDGKPDTLGTLSTLIASSVTVGHPSTAAQHRATRRAERRLSRRAAQIAVWWSKLPKPRPMAYRPDALELALNLTLQRAATSLRWLGWQRITRRIRGKPTTLWLPPASPLKPQPKGRPRVYPCD